MKSEEILAVNQLRIVNTNQSSSKKESCPLCSGEPYNPKLYNKLCSQCR